MYYNDSHPASCPAQTYSDTTDCITSSLRCDTITFPAMRCSTSPTPIGLGPGFLSRGSIDSQEKLLKLLTGFR